MARRSPGPNPNSSPGPSTNHSPNPFALLTQFAKPRPNPNPKPNQVNHAILKWYADGTEQSSPPHQDKAEGVDGATADKCDMERDAAFYVFSFHDSSTFEFYLQRGRGVPNPSKAKNGAKLLKIKDIVWKKALASGSLLKVSAKDNLEYFHALHKTKVDHNSNPNHNLHVTLTLILTYP